MRTAGSKWLLGAAILLLLLFPISLCIGRYAISLSELCQILTGGEAPDMARQVFFRLRLPRTIMAVLEQCGRPRGDFYRWQVKNGGGYCFYFDTETQMASEIRPL